ADKGEYEMTVALTLPAHCKVDKDVNTPRLPSVRRRYERRDAGAPGAVILTFADYEGADEKEYGLSGSPTRVERIFPPEVNREKELLTGTGAELSARLTEELRRQRRM
ncbi:MAG: electron transfer flavoprotein subunit beta, partial [Clostridia bacterium]|nr:electron transfer flavoprotein subunit beta [Clostridia bacterium]